MAQILNNPLEKERLERDIEELFSDPNEWRRRRHELLGGRTPDKLLDGGEEDREQLRNLLEAIKHGMVS